MGEGQNLMSAPTSLPPAAPSGQLTALPIWTTVAGMRAPRTRQAALPEHLARWGRRGSTERVLDRDVFVVDEGPRDASTVVLLHGFPGSSADWRGVLPRLTPTHRVVTLDLPGYGFSGKPPTGDYSLFRQADVVEGVLAGHGVERCTLVAHDMGDTVAAELMARAHPAVRDVVLTNGSIFIDQAYLPRGQRLLLRLPRRALPFAPPGVVLRRSLAESFADTAPAPPGVVDDLVAMVRRRGGDRLLPLLIGYIGERREHQDRWTAALVDHPGRLTALWGGQDPIAVTGMVRHLAALRPDVAVRVFDHLGHWPSLEAPDELADALLAVLADGTSDPDLLQ